MVRQLFQLMGRPVAEVERPGRSLFKRISAPGDMREVEVSTSVDHRLHGRHAAAPKGGYASLQILEKVRALNDGNLDGFRNTCPPVTVGQRSQESRVVYLGIRRGERADPILLLKRVDAILDPYASIVLGEHTGRQPDESASPVCCGSSISGDVEHRPATNCHHK